MEFTEEFIKENNLNEDQVKAISSFASNQIADLKKEWDGKATANAEKILDGVIKPTEELTGIKREPGEKHADYLKKAHSGYFEGTKTSLDRQKAELEEKIKKAGTDEGLKSQLQDKLQEIEALKTQMDDFKKKAATYDEWEKEDYKGKYEKTAEELTSTRKQIAFSNVKPKFAEEVNEYEAKAKWDKFVSNVSEKYNIAFDKENNEPIAIDRENEHKVRKLSDLVNEDKELQELVKGRSLTGLGTKNKKDVQLEGIPFKIPEGATPSEVQKAIRDYLTVEKKLEFTSSEYAKQFDELNKKVLKAKSAVPA